MIRIITGPIGSGKTTRLENWVRSKRNIAGILMPVIEGGRHLWSIRSGRLVPVEAHEKRSSDEIVKIGKFIFARRVFDWGNSEIIAGFEENKIIVIDEIGPLELNGEGFAPALNTILDDKKRLRELDLILVVRESLIDPVTRFFKISGYEVVFLPEEIEIK